MEYITEKQAKKAIIDVGQRMYTRGFVAANDGNISVRTGDNEVWATPTGVSKGYMKKKMLVKVDLDGNVMEGTYKASSELKMHLRAYRENEDIKAVCHAHPPICTCYAIAGLPLSAPVLAEAGFDVEIVEKHHNRKLDAPSGTALALADRVRGVLGEEYAYIYDRSGRRERRPRKEIGISAVRGGTIVGDHDVIFAGTDEVITFSHRAYSREVFAKGAIQAAKYLAGRPAGRYDMSDVIEG